jgi:hypothetical protein
MTSGSIDQPPASPATRSASQCRSRQDQITLEGAAGQVAALALLFLAIAWWRRL